MKCVSLPTPALQEDVLYFEIDCISNRLKAHWPFEDQH